MRRELNIECLRCVAMLFIVLNHCILNIATKQLTLDISPINFCITNFIYQVVYNGVNIFVLISGYFLVDTTDGKPDIAFEIVDFRIFFSRYYQTEYKLGKDNETLVKCLFLFCSYLYSLCCISL